MPEPAARIVALGLEAYVVAGALFAPAFVALGVDRLDVRAAGAAWTFRLLMVPGSALFWPLLAIRWARARRRP